jgi:flavin-binding protein dodecin
VTVVKVLELVGESQQSWQDAANQAVMEAAKTVHNITGVEVSNWTAHVNDGRISNYKANVRLAFVVDGDRHAPKA